MEKSFKKILIVICLLATVCSYAITLRWNASGDSTVVGYKLKYDTNGNFTNVIDVGNVTNFTISNTNFVDGNTYYFEAVAYDNLSNESNVYNANKYVCNVLHYKWKRGNVLDLSYIYIIRAKYNYDVHHNVFNESHNMEYFIHIVSD